MKLIGRVCTLTLLVPALAALLLTESSAAQTSQPSPASAAYPSEMPAKFEPVTASFDYTRRDVMIPMRDGVKLHTVILVPKGARNAPCSLNHARSCVTVPPEASWEAARQARSQICSTP